MTMTSVWEFGSKAKGTYFDYYCGVAPIETDEIVSCGQCVEWLLQPHYDFVRNRGMAFGPCQLCAWLANLPEDNEVLYKPKSGPKPEKKIRQLSLFEELNQ